MPRKDKFHELVRRLLEVAGWTITHSQLLRPFMDTKVYMDLGAEREGRKIAVEVKNFESNADVSEWEKAIGQFLIYQAVLSVHESDRQIYLAIPSDAWETFRFSHEGQSFLKNTPLRVIVYNSKTEVIEEWID